jgi:hypothetical protein
MRAKQAIEVPPPASTRKAVVILGMHRSGTSALGGALQLLGVNFGQRLAPPGRDNEKGYWEHPEIVALHEKLLRSLGSHWDDDKPLPSDWAERKITQDVRSLLTAILERDFADSALFGLKDPRMCRLMPLWFPIFEAARVEPHFVLVVRHPSDVAKSLAKRNGIEPPKGYLLWLEHVVQAESATRSHQRSFLHYDEMVDDPVEILGELRKQLGVNLHNPSQIQTPLRNFLDPSMRHHQLNNETGDKLKKPVPQLVLDFYEAIRNGSTLQEIARKMKPLVAQFIRGRDLFYPRIDLVEAPLASLIKKIAKSKETRHLLDTSDTAAQLSTQLLELSRVSDERAKRVLHLQSEFEDKVKHVVLLRDELKKKSEQVVHFRHEFEVNSRRAAQFKSEAEERSRHITQLQQDLQEKATQVLHFQRESDQHAQRLERVRNQFELAEERLTRAQNELLDARWEALTLRGTVLRAKSPDESSSFRLVELQNRAETAASERDHLRAMLTSLQNDFEQERAAAQVREDELRDQLKAALKDLRSEQKQMDRLRENISRKLILPFGKSQRKLQQLTASRRADD